MTLFKTELDGLGGQLKREEKDEDIHRPKAFQKERIFTLRKGNKLTILYGQLPGCSYT